MINLLGVKIIIRLLGDTLKMKKFTAVLFATMAVSLFTGCIKIKQTKTIIGFVQVGHESAWRNACTNSFKTTFTESRGYELRFFDADNSQKRQIEAVRQLINEDVDYIVIAPVVETGWDEVLQEAKNVGIPVIICDRKIKVEDESLYVCWIGSDFEKEAQKAVEWLDEYIRTQMIRKKDVINILHFQGTMGSSAQLGRTQGITTGVITHRGWNIQSFCANFSEEEGKNLMDDYINLGKPLPDVIIAENDDMGWGIVDALEKNGIKPGEDIIIITFDANRKTLEYIMDGRINCCIECNPILGPEIEKIISTLKQGRIVDDVVEKENYITEQLFDKPNVNTYYQYRLY